jgi:anaerobic magnesium-protoporphyrin IX monomethyl ester cyclase
MRAEVPAKSTLLGLGYIASVLRMNGHKVTLRDLYNKDNIDIPLIDYDVLGVSSMFTQYKDTTIELLKNVKRYFPNIFIIVGGAHASTFPEEMEEYSDSVVVGEGEEVINDIILNRKKGIVKTNRIKNLDNLPNPAWDLMMEDVKEINRLSSKSPFLMRRPLAHIITSRGCPNNCTFCAVKVEWGRLWIPRSASNVVDEISYLYNLGFREIHFNDDNCSVDKNRMYEICDLIKNRKIDIKIACPTGIHIKTLDKDLLKLMKEVGFYRLCFGIESGNQEMQHKIKKNLDLEKAKEVIRDANSLGYWTSATFILGFPQETESQRLETLEFAKSSNLDFPIFYNLIPQPKTEIYDELKSIL